MLGFRCSDLPAEVKPDAGKPGDGSTSEIPWDVVSSTKIEGGIDCAESISIMPCHGYTEVAEPVKNSGNGRCWPVKMSWLWLIRSILSGIISCDAQMLLIFQIVGYAERTSAMT